MPTTIKGVHCRSLRVLERVLAEWVKMNIRIAQEWQGNDVPWWYNERASLSGLAGAVWLARGVAFEEFVADKRTGQKRRPMYPGRNDLYLKIGRHEFIAEAKWSWSGAVRVSDRTADHIQQNLDQACADVRKCPRDGQRKLGVVFATPYIARSEKKRVDQRIDEWVTTLKRVDYSCSAWVFPKDSRQFSGTESICPGAAVLIREV